MPEAETPDGLSAPLTVYMRDMWRAVREPGPNWQGRARLTCQDQSRRWARCAGGPTGGESGEGHET